MGGGQQAQAPQIVPGFENMPQLLTQLAQQAQQGYQGPLAAGPSQAEQSIFAGLNQTGLGGLLQNALQSLGGLAGGDMLMDIEQRLRPAMVDRPFQEGAAGLREQLALGGGLSGTDFMKGLTDLSGNLERSFQAALPQAAASLTQAQTGAANTLFGGSAGLAGLERGINDLGMQRGLQESQFMRGLAPQAMQGLGAGMSGIPMFQPQTGPGKGEQLMGLAGGAAGAFGGPMMGQMGGALGAKFGNKMANK